MTEFARLQSVIERALKDQNITGVDIYKMTCSVMMGQSIEPSLHSNLTGPPSAPPKRCQNCDD